MLDWLRRAFGRSGDDERKRLFETIDALNAETGGGETVATTNFLGRLRLWSGTVRVNPVRAEVVGPVSEDLADEIKAFLKADPRYSDYPFMYFHVQTNNSFDRANYI